MSNNEIRPGDLIMKNLIELIMDQGISYEATRRIALGDLQGSNRTKKRDKLDRVYESYIKVKLTND